MPYQARAKCSRSEAGPNAPEKAVRHAPASPDSRRFNLNLLSDIDQAHETALYACAHLLPSPTCRPAILASLNRRLLSGG